MILYKYLEEGIKKYATIGGILGGLAGAYYGAKQGESDVISFYKDKLLKFDPTASKYLAPKPNVDSSDPLKYKVNKGILGLFSTSKDDEVYRLKYAAAKTTTKFANAEEKLHNLQKNYITARDDKDLGYINRFRKAIAHTLFGKSPAEKDTERLKSMLKNADSVYKLNKNIQTIERDISQAKFAGAVNVGLAGAGAGAAAGAGIGLLTKSKKDKDKDSPTAV